MAGVKGMRLLGRTHKSQNQWTTGQKTRERSRYSWSFRPISNKGVWGFKPMRDKLEVMYADMEKRGIESKSAYLELAVSQLLDSPREQLPEVAIEALKSAIAQKKVAISREKRRRNSDESLISQWKLEVTELEKLI